MKEKIESICFLAQKGMNRNIVINGKEHKFTVDMDVEDVVRKLSSSYELTKSDTRDIKMIW